MRTADRSPASRFERAVRRGITAAAWSAAWLAGTALAASAAEGTATEARGDPLHSAECRHAMADLQAHERLVAQNTTSGADTAGQRARLQTLRSVAAKACLGTAADPDRPQITHVQPLPEGSVLPRPALPRLPPPQAASPRVDSPLPRPEPLRSVTSCDANGCWASDGTRLQRMGPGLLGPRGFCSLQGAVVSCP